MANVNPLISVPSPRDIPVVLEAHKRLPYDRFYVKYYPERQAYPLMRRYFLENKQYTHLVIAPDDLVVEQAHVDILIKDLQEHDYPILSGVCNVNNEPQNKDKWNICKDALISPRRDARDYPWMTQADFDPDNPILQVRFSGFPLMFIRRDIVEQIEFEDDCAANGFTGTGGGVDVMFCYSCEKRNIPIHADLRVRMLHLSGEYRVLKVGREPAYCHFEKG